MAKKTMNKKANSQPQDGKLHWNQWMGMRHIMALNTLATQSRDALLQRFKVRDVDMNYECRWPETIAAKDYKDLFERNALAGRVVMIWPSECWILPPEIYESEKAKTRTETEQTWDDLNKELGLLSDLFLLDVLSGIGRYGLLVFGLDDLKTNETFEKPVEGFDERTGEVSKPLGLELLYTRVYQESDVTILAWDQDKSHKRYGLPILYQVTMEDPTGGGTSRTEKVHWTRVQHQVDNRLSSRVFGEPRMKPVYNELIDAVKVKGGGSEGYWRACLSGTAWGLDPQLMDPNTVISEDQKDDMYEELEKFYNGMQRSLVGIGLKPFDIAPKLVDPSPFIDTLIKLICIRINVPMPVFAGREEGQLAAPDQWKTWIDRIIGRQNNYLTPELMQPFLHRLQMYGALPETAEELRVDWPDRNAPTDDQVATTADKMTTALAKYVAGNVNQLIGEDEYLGQVLHKTPEEIEAISAEISEWEELNNPPEPEPVMPTPGDNKGGNPNGSPTSGEPNGMPANG